MQLGLVLSVQPPDEEAVMPAAVRREAAWDWVRGVPERGTAVAEVKVRAARVVRMVVNYVLLVGSVMVWWGG